VYYSKQGEKIKVLVRKLMSKSGFEDEVLIKLIVGVVKHVTIDELGPVDYRCNTNSQRARETYKILAARQNKLLFLSVMAEDARQLSARTRPITIRPLWWGVGDTNTIANRNS
jgi:hypothetical protein